MQFEQLEQRFDAVVATRFTGENAQHEVDLGVRALGVEFVGHGWSIGASSVLLPLSVPTLRPSRAKYTAPMIVIGMKLSR